MNKKSSVQKRPQEQKNKTVLVMEDEKSLLSAIKKKLELNDFSVVTARSVDEALKRLAETGSINLIWLDHYLLGKDNGFDFMAKIRRGSKRYKHIPVFVVTNTASHEKVQLYKQLGIGKYYTKADYRLDHIISDIKEHLSNKR